MKTSSETKAGFAKRRPWLFLSIVAAGLAVFLVFVGMTISFFSNHAAKTARPFEVALARAGGVKKCDMGDAGRGPDNNAPWYSVYYELPLNRERAVETINEIAANNGYSLRHASKQDHGPITAITDAYINNWFYNTSDISSPYRDLQTGPVTLRLALNNDGPFDLSNLSCRTPKSVKVNNNASTTAVTVEVQLPPFKRWPF